MRYSKGHGFLLSFMINLLFRTGWLIFLVILLILHFAVKLPLWLIFIPLGCWIIHALLITLLLSLANGASESVAAQPKQKNVNPYSKSNNDFR